MRSSSCLPVLRVGQRPENAEIELREWVETRPQRLERCGARDREAARRGPHRRRRGRGATEDGPWGRRHRRPRWEQRRWQWRTHLRALRSRRSPSASEPVRLTVDRSAWLRYSATRPRAKMQIRYENASSGPWEIKSSDSAIFVAWLGAICPCRKRARGSGSTSQGCGRCSRPGNWLATSWGAVGSSRRRVSRHDYNFPRVAAGSCGRPMPGRHCLWRRATKSSAASSVTDSECFGSSRTAALKDSSPGCAIVRRHSASTVTQARWADSRRLTSYACREPAPPGHMASGWSPARRSTPTSHRMPRTRSPRSSGWSCGIRRQTSSCVYSLVRWERRPLAPSRRLPPLRSTWPSSPSRGRHALVMRFYDASIASGAGALSPESSSLERSAGR